MKSYIIKFVSFFIVILSYIFDANGEEKNVVEDLTKVIYRNEEDLSVYRLQLDRMVLNSAILVYNNYDSGQIVIPLNEFLTAIEFPITFDLDSKTASGWFISENQEFELNLSEKFVSVKGKRTALTLNQVELHEDDLYVELKQLEAWFPILLENDLNEQSIRVKPILPIPIQIRMEKEAKREKISIGNKRKQKSIYSESPSLFSVPQADLSIQSSFTNGDFKEKYSLSASGLVLKQHTRFRVHQTSELSNIKLTIEDKNTDNDLFGLMGTEYAMGDINTFTVPLISNGKSGRGIFYSTMPFSAGNSVQSGQVELIGELPVGYEVDIIQNGQLIGFQDTQNENGEYEFVANARPGLNIFELIFYGPQGQKFTKTEKFFIPTNFIGSNALGTKFSFIQENTDLFNDSDDIGNGRLILQTEYGIDSMTGFYGAFVSYKDSAERKNYGLVRYSRSFMGARSDFSFVAGEIDDYALGMRFQGSLNGLSWNFELQHLEKLKSEYKKNLSGGFDIKQALKSGISGILPYTVNMPFYINYEGYYSPDKYRNKVNFNVTKPFRFIRVSSNTTYINQNNNKNSSNTQFQFSTSWKNVNLRGSTSLNLVPEFKFNMASINVRYSINDKYNLNSSYQINGVNKSNFSLGYSQTFKHFSLGFSSAYDQGSGLSASLNFSMGLGYNSLNKNTFVTSKKLVNTSSAITNVYYDKNDNNKYDEEEEKLSNVKFIGSNKSLVDRESDDNGNIFLYGVSPYSRIKLQIDPTTLDDISLYSLNENFDYRMKPSQLMYIDFPISFRGEIDGQINEYKNGRERAGESIELDLVSWRTGKVVANKKSQYDGFVLFESVPADKYYLKVNKAFIKRVNLCEPRAEQLVVDNDNPFVSFSTKNIFKKNKLEHGDIVFWEGKDIKTGLDYWEKIKSVLSSIVFSRDENAFSYLKTYDGENWELAFDNINKKNSDRYCQSLKKNNLRCSIRYTDPKYCPVDVILLEQIKLAG